MGPNRDLTRIVRRIHASQWRTRFQRLRAPIVQLVAAVGVMVGGAALIGAWMVGVVLMVGGLLIAADAFLRDVPAKAHIGGHENVIEAYRRAR